MAHQGVKRYPFLYVTTEEFNQLISDWLMTQPGRDDVVATLGAQRVPVAPVLSIEEALSNPHLRQNRTLRTVHDERLGPVDIPGMPIRFSAFPAELDLAAASLGAHNEQVVRGLLGKDADTYDRLVASGVLRHEPES